MGFVNEKISEADRVILNSFNLKNPYTDEALDSRRWTIDRERDAFNVEARIQNLYIANRIFGEPLGDLVDGVDALKRSTVSLITGVSNIKDEIKEAIDRNSNITKQRMEQIILDRDIQIYYKDIVML